MAKATTKPWIDRLVQFTRTDLYANYYECLRLEREEIIMAGKRSRDPHILSKLDGFDQAASFFERQIESVRRSNEVKEDLDNDD